MEMLWWLVTILWATVTGLMGLMIGFGVGRSHGEDNLVAYIHECLERGCLKWDKTMYRVTPIDDD